MIWSVVLRYITHPLDLFSVSHTCVAMRSAVMESRGCYAVGFVNEVKDTTMGMPSLSELVSHDESYSRRAMANWSTFPERVLLQHNQAYPRHTNSTILSIQRTPTIDYLGVLAEKSTQQKPRRSSASSDSDADREDSFLGSMDHFHCEVPEIATALILGSLHIRRLDLKIESLRKYLEELFAYRTTRDGSVPELSYEEAVCAAGVLEDAVLSVEDKNQSLFHIEHRLLPMNDIANRDIRAGIPFDYARWSLAWRDVQMNNIMAHPTKMIKAFRSKIPPSNPSVESKKMKAQLDAARTILKSILPEAFSTGLGPAISNSTGNTNNNKRTKSVESEEGDDVDHHHHKRRKHTKNVGVSRKETRG